MPGTLRQIAAWEPANQFARNSPEPGIVATIPGAE